LRWLISSVSWRAREAPDVGRHGLQRGHVGRGADRAADLLDRQPLQREQVALGNDADHPAFARVRVVGLGHREVADAVARHRERRVLRGVVGGQADHRRAHHLADRGGQRHAGQRDAVKHVVAGQDAARAAVVVVEHQHRADAHVAHRAQRLRQRRARGHPEGRAPHQPAQRRLERLLGQRLRGVGHLQRAPRQLEEMLHAAVEEVGKRRAVARQRVHRRQRQQQAEGVGLRGVGGRHRALADGCADREQVADLDLEAGFFGRAARAHMAAAQEQQVRDHAAGRRQHHLARLEVGLAAGRHEALHLRCRHLGEGREAHQLGAELRHQAGGRAEAHARSISNGARKRAPRGALSAAQGSAQA
jgi:hypothetical protein